MKIRKIIYFTLVSTVFLSASPASSKESAYPEFAELVHNYHVAYRDIAIETLISIYLIGESLNQEPKIGAITATSNTLNEKAEAFEKASKEMHDFLGKNKGSLVRSKNVIEKIESDSSLDNISMINEFSGSFSAFSSAAKELEFTVYANEGWANSGISVHPGDIVWVESKGSWRVSSNYDYVGWQGYINNTSKTYSLNNTVPLGALLFRVRGSSNPDGAGLNEKKRGRIDSNGRLEFIINDSDRRNNDGQLNLRAVIFDGEKLKTLIQALQNMKNDTTQ